MDIEFDKVKLKKILISFFDLTGITISVYNDKQKHITSYPNFDVNYCKTIRSNPSLLQNCTKYDVYNFNKCFIERKPFIYTCHAGIAEIVIPLFYENIIIGYMMLGRFVDKDNVYSSIDKVKITCLKYYLNEKKMLKNYQALPKFTHKEIEAIINLAQMCINNLYMQQIISFNTNMLSTKIENYINQNLIENITVEMLCKKFYVGRKTLYKLFKNNFNDTIKNYINSKRINQAKILLKSKNYSISEIAEKVGFKDYNYFIRIFHKKEGISPLQYKKII